MGTDRTIQPGTDQSLVTNVLPLCTFPGSPFLSSDMTIRHSYTRILSVDETGPATVQKTPRERDSFSGSKISSRSLHQSHVDIQAGEACDERGTNIITVPCCTSPPGPYINPMLIYKQGRACDERGTNIITVPCCTSPPGPYINPMLIYKQGRACDERGTNIITVPCCTSPPGPYINPMLIYKQGRACDDTKDGDVKSIVKASLNTYHTDELEKWLRANPCLYVTQSKVALLIGIAYGRAATVGCAVGACRAMLVLPGITVAERLACSPPTKAKRVHLPTGSPDFREWESRRTMPLVGGFSRVSPVSLTPSFRRCSISTSIILIGSQGLAPASRTLRCADARSRRFPSIWSVLSSLPRRLLLKLQPPIHSSINSWPGGPSHYPHSTGLDLECSTHPESRLEKLWQVIVSHSGCGMVLYEDINGRCVSAWEISSKCSRSDTNKTADDGKRKKDILPIPERLCSVDRGLLTANSIQRSKKLEGETGSVRVACVECRGLGVGLESVAMSGGSSYSVDRTRLRYGCWVYGMLPRRKKQDALSLTALPRFGLPIGGEEESCSINARRPRLMRPLARPKAQAWHVRTSLPLLPQSFRDPRPQKSSVWYGRGSIHTPSAFPGHNRSRLPLTTQPVIDSGNLSTPPPAYGVNHYQHESNPMIGHQREPHGGANRSSRATAYFPWHLWVIHARHYPPNGVTRGIPFHKWLRRPHRA
ncbi:hypothetical protein PR048_023872 [Dryococelus australis]|uniref:Uncharacterized protein n=1 Tax=Dryococelus australis TaxID=614101 RepID=A0ABQ9GVG7_9NEOP|nr:hypothetical protein PR048_023872 [Dryococelus australis]